MSQDPKGTTTTEGKERPTAFDWVPATEYRCIRCGALYLVKGWADRCPGCFLRAEGPS